MQIFRGSLFFIHDLNASGSKKTQIFRGSLFFIHDLNASGLKKTQTFRGSLFFIHDLNASGSKKNPEGMVVLWKSIGSSIKNPERVAPKAGAKYYFSGVVEKIPNK